MATLGISRKYDFNLTDDGKIFAGEFNKIVGTLDGQISQTGVSDPDSNKLLVKSIDRVTKGNVYRVSPGVSFDGITYKLSRDGFDSSSTDSLYDGMTFGFIPHATNVSTDVNLRIYTLDSKPLVTTDGSQLSPSELIVGKLYTVRYDMNLDKFLILNDGHEFANKTGDPTVIFDVGTGCGDRNAVNGECLDKKLRSLGVGTVEQLYLGSKLYTTISGMEDSKVQAMNDDNKSHTWTYPPDNGYRISVNDAISSGLAPIDSNDPTKTEWFCVGFINGYITENALACIQGEFYCREDGFNETTPYATNKVRTAVELFITRDYKQENDPHPIEDGATNPFNNIQEYLEYRYNEAIANANIATEVATPVTLAWRWNFARRPRFIISTKVSTNNWMSILQGQMGFIFARFVNIPASSTTGDMYYEGKFSVAFYEDITLETLNNKLKAYHGNIFRVTGTLDQLIYIADGYAMDPTYTIKAGTPVTISLHSKIDTLDISIDTLTPGDTITLTTELKSGHNEVGFLKELTFAELESLVGVGNILEIRSNFSDLDYNVNGYYCAPGYVPNKYKPGAIYDVNTFVNTVVGQGYILVLKEPCVLTYDCVVPSDGVESLPFVGNSSLYHMRGGSTFNDDASYTPYGGDPQPMTDVVSSSYLANIGGTYDYRRLVEPAGIANQTQNNL